MSTKHTKTGSLRGSARPSREAAPAKRTERRAGAKTAALIYQEGVRRFYDVGYHAATLRQIAEQVGVNAPALYYHYPSKEELLFAIVSKTMGDLIDGCAAAVPEAADPPEKLRAFMREHVRFHGVRQLEAGVSDMEYRHLAGDQLAKAVELRDRFQQMLVEILEEGMTTGAFAVTDLKTTAYAVLTVGTNVSLWYRPDGRMTLDEIADEYGEIALRMVGVRE